MQRQGKKMFKKILVPLDGSKLAECALPYAIELAKGCKAEEIMLVSVTERVVGRISNPEVMERYEVTPPPVVPKRSMLTSDFKVDVVGGTQSGVDVTFGKKEEQAQKYLLRIVKRTEKSVLAQGIEVRAEVLLWPPAEAIVSYAENNGADIIVISSHGRSGVSRWAFGSVADKVFRSSCIPVLMVKAPGCTPGI